MSCFMVSENTLSRLLDFLEAPMGGYGGTEHVYHSFPGKRGGILGGNRMLSESRRKMHFRLLSATNALSMCERYADMKIGRDIKLPKRESRRVWESHPYRSLMTPIEALKACDCYEYQSCEWRGWAGSMAETIINVIRRKATRNLPGYDEAEWG